MYLDCYVIFIYTFLFCTTGKRHLSVSPSAMQKYIPRKYSCSWSISRNYLCVVDFLPSLSLSLGGGGGGRRVSEVHTSLFFSFCLFQFLCHFRAWLDHVAFCLSQKKAAFLLINFAHCLLFLVFFISFSSSPSSSS